MWRRSTPQRVHASGLWGMKSSEAVTRERCAPGAPGRLPGFLPIAGRPFRFGFSCVAGAPKVSEDGGMEELNGLRQSFFSSSATVRAMTPTLPLRSDTSSRSVVFSADNLAFSRGRCAAFFGALPATHTGTASLDPNREHLTRTNALVTRVFGNFPGGAGISGRHAHWRRGLWYGLGVRRDWRPREWLRCNRDHLGFVSRLKYTNTRPGGAGSERARD